MKEFIREIRPDVKLYKDSTSGLAWIADGRTGLGISVHPNISSSGSVRGMKERGWWGKHDRIIRSHGFQYNIDRFVCDKTNELEVIVSNECMCPACVERRERAKS